MIDRKALDLVAVVGATKEDVGVIIVVKLPLLFVLPIPFAFDVGDKAGSQSLEAIPL